MDDKSKYPDGYFRLVVIVLGVCLLITLLSGWVMVYLITSLFVVNTKLEQTPPPEPVEQAVFEIVELPSQIDQGAKEFGKVKVEATVKPADERRTKIFNYLVAYGSPIPDITDTIVNESDRYGVDPYLITAIFCQESSCGKSCSNGSCGGYGFTDSGPVGKTDYENYKDGMADMIARYATDWENYYLNCGSDIVCVSELYNPRESWVDSVGWFYDEISK